MVPFGFHVLATADTYSNSSQSPDIELSKVKQDSKRYQLLAILEDPEACHQDRLDFARFLIGTAGYSVEDLLSIIHAGNHWSDYSANMTYLQVSSVAKWLDNRNNSHISNKVVSLPSFLYSSNKESVVTNPFYAADDCPCRIQWTACSDCKTKGCMISGSFQLRSK